MSERKFSVDPKHPLLPYIGDFKFGDTFLDSKHGLEWVILKYLNALFRGVGQVIFCNNPFSGLVILLCLYWADFTVGLATTLAASTAILTAFIFQQDVSNINAGLTTYNAVLVGSVTASLWTPTFGEPLSLKVWGFIILAAALSVLVNIAIGNLFGSFKIPLPSFTFAFNIVTILLFTVVAPPPTTTQTSRTFSRDENDERMRIDIPGMKYEILWGGVIRGILLSMGQVYAVNNLEGSILMYCSTMFYSPSVFMMSFVGATVGSVFGLVFAEPPYTTVYDGVWGFNGILAAIAVGCFYFALTWLSFITALADVVMAVIIQQALTIAFTPLRLPCFTYPFVLSSILFLEITATGNLLYRVPKFSVPEIHKYEYLKMLRDKKNGPKSPSSRDDGHPIYNDNNAYQFKPSAPSHIYPNVANHNDFYKPPGYYVSNEENLYKTQPPSYASGIGFRQTPASHYSNNYYTDSDPHHRSYNENQRPNTSSNYNQSNLNSSFNQHFQVPQYNSYPNHEQVRFEEKDYPVQRVQYYRHN